MAGACIPAESTLVENQICKELLPIVSIKRVGDFYSIYLTHLTSEKMHSEIPLIIEEYTSAVPEEKWAYITLAYAYLEIGEYEKALTIISKHTDYSNNDYKTRYYASKESTRGLSMGYIGQGVPYQSTGRETGQGYPCDWMERKT